MGSGVIFGVKYQILATKTKMLGKQRFLGCMCGLFGALMGPWGVSERPKVGILSWPEFFSCYLGRKDSLAYQEHSI